MIAGILKYVFFAFNLLMAFAMYSGYAEKPDKINNASETGAPGVVVGTGLGSFFPLVLWVMGDIIFGLLYLVARPSKG
tara:strand:+ start:291 stop:524 length:234 start_codon:yes stop_codon:yes gene_type:complete